MPWNVVSVSSGITGWRRWDSNSRTLDCQAARTVLNVGCRAESSAGCLPRCPRNSLDFPRTRQTPDQKCSDLGFSVEAKGLEPSNLLTASQALYQLSYAPEG
jgi:hypothetical protein